ncbi:IS66 C-terminal element, partial [Limosilactobacillus mucosae]
GAKANAIWYSIVQTAKLNHLDVFKYLEPLLSAFTKRETPEIEAYLPWAREIQESCKA